MAKDKHSHGGFEFHERITEAGFVLNSRGDKYTKKVAVGAKVNITLSRYSHPSLNLVIGEEITWFGCYYQADEMLARVNALIALSTLKPLT